MEKNILNKKRIDQVQRDKFWAIGEKAIKFEPFQKLECIRMGIYSVMLLAKLIMITMEYQGEKYLIES